MFLTTITKTYDSLGEALIDVISSPVVILCFIFLAIVIFGLYACKSPKLRPMAGIINIIGFIICSLIVFIMSKVI